MKKVVVSLFMAASIALVSCSKDLIAPADQTTNFPTARTSAARPDTSKNKKPCPDSTGHKRDSLDRDHAKGDSLKTNKPPKDTLNQGGTKPKKKKGK